LHPQILSNSLKPLNHYSYIVRTGLITYYIRKAGLPKGKDNVYLKDRSTTRTKDELQIG